MCDQTEVVYSPKDVVWIKFHQLWWPGRVIPPEEYPEDDINTLNFEPIAVVKFFQENTYEYVQNISHIYHYNCLKKDEFIRKGLEMYRKHIKTNEQSMEFLSLFPNDIATAESLTGGDPDIVNSEAFRPPEKVDYSHIFSSSSSPSKKSATKKSVVSKKFKRVEPYSSKLTPLRVVTHPRFIKASVGLPTGYRSKIMPSSMVAASSDVSLYSSIYNCFICSFTTSRQNNIVMHYRSHSANSTMPADRKKGRKRKLKVFKEPQHAATAAAAGSGSPVKKSNKTPASRKRPKKTKLAEQTPKTKVVTLSKRQTENQAEQQKPAEDDGLHDSLLSDWADYENLEQERLEDQKSMNSQDKSEADFVMSTPTDSQINSQNISKNETESDAKKNISCFDFDDSEDSFPIDNTNIKYGRIIPKKLGRTGNEERSNLPKTESRNLISIIEVEYPSDEKSESGKTGIELADSGNEENMEDESVEDGSVEELTENDDDDDDDDKEEEELAVEDEEELAQNGEELPEDDEEELIDEEELTEDEEGTNECRESIIEEEDGNDSLEETLDDTAVTEADDSKQKEQCEKTLIADADQSDDVSRKDNVSSTENRVIEVSETDVEISNSSEFANIQVNGVTSSGTKHTEIDDDLEEHNEQFEKLLQETAIPEFPQVPITFSQTTSLIKGSNVQMVEEMHQKIIHADDFVDEDNDLSSSVASQKEQEAEPEFFETSIVDDERDELNDFIIFNKSGGKTDSSEEKNDISSKNNVPATSATDSTANTLCVVDSVPLIKSVIAGNNILATQIKEKFTTLQSLPEVSKYSTQKDQQQQQQQQPPPPPIQHNMVKVGSNSYTVINPKILDGKTELNLGKNTVIRLQGPHGTKIGQLLSSGIKGNVIRTATGQTVILPPQQRIVLSSNSIAGTSQVASQSNSGQKTTKYIITGGTPVSKSAVPNLNVISGSDVPLRNSTQATSLTPRNIQIVNTPRGKVQIVTQKVNVVPVSGTSLLKQTNVVSYSQRSQTPASPVSAATYRFVNKQTPIPNVVRCISKLGTQVSTTASSNVTLPVQQVQMQRKTAAIPNVVAAAPPPKIMVLPRNATQQQLPSSTSYRIVNVSHPSVVTKGNTANQVVYQVVGTKPNVQGKILQNIKPAIKPVATTLANVSPLQPQPQQQNKSSQLILASSPSTSSQANVVVRVPEKKQTSQSHLSMDEYESLRCLQQSGSIASDDGTFVYLDSDDELINLQKSLAADQRPEKEDILAKALQNTDVLQNDDMYLSEVDIEDAEFVTLPLQAVNSPDVSETGVAEKPIMIPPLDVSSPLQSQLPTSGSQLEPIIISD